MNQEYSRLFSGLYARKTVLVTGHTGFKGSWLCRWLTRMGAKVHGLSLEPNTDPNHFTLLPDATESSTIQDIREVKQVSDIIARIAPEIIFHLAAQPIVRRSYRDPIDTFSTNVMGTAHVLLAANACERTTSVVCVTSDKVYYNAESESGYTESDRLGGKDPYSCSKACTEIIAECFREGIYSRRNSPLRLATARAGNVIGGGDWGEDRLIPDAVRAIASNSPLAIRNPAAVRPWQHVLEPLSGYLLLGAKLLAGSSEACSAWNFGPRQGLLVSVGEVIDTFRQTWPVLRAEYSPCEYALPETNVLMVSSQKAAEELGWSPVWDVEKAIMATASWYQKWFEEGLLLTDTQLDDYVAEAYRDRKIWVGP